MSGQALAKGRLQAIKSYYRRTADEASDSLDRKYLGELIDEIDRTRADAVCLVCHASCCPMCSICHGCGNTFCERCNDSHHHAAPDAIRPGGES